MCGTGAAADPVRFEQHFKIAGTHVVEAADNALTKFGSPQEFDGARILSRFPENHEFGPGRRHALALQQQVAQVLVSPPAAQQ